MPSWVESSDTELTEAGLRVVALERGPARDTLPDGAYPRALDELTYNVRRKLFQDLSRETVTIRHGLSDTALPYRELGAFLPGTGVGGAGLCHTCRCAQTELKP